MKKRIEKVICLVLCTAIASTSVVFADDSTLLGTQKDETVYVMMNPDGSIKKQTVSSWLHNDQGIQNVSETVELHDIKNVKGNEQPSASGDTLIWNLNGNDVYYQGQTDKTPPVTMKITYRLDGQEMSAEQIAGKSGAVQIDIQLRNHVKSTVAVAGKQREIYTPFLAVAVCDLSADHFKNVKCDGAEVLSDSNNQICTMTALPGLKESLGDSYDLLQELGEFELKDQFTITAKADHFELAPIVVAVTNELPLEALKKAVDIDELTDALDSMKDAAGQLVDGSSQLADGIKIFSSKMDELEKSLDPFSEGVGKVSGGAAQLQDGTSQVADGVKQYTAAVNEIFTALTGKMADLEKQLAAAQKGLTDDLTKLGSDAAATAKDMEGIMTQIVTLQKKIEVLEQQGAIAQPAADSLKETATELYKQLAAHIQTLTNVSEDVKKVASAAGQLSGSLNEQYTAMKRQLEPLRKTLAEKSKQLNEGAQKTAAGAATLAEGTQSLQDGDSKLASGVKQLNEATGTLQDASGELASGTKRFKAEAVDKIDEKVGGKLADVKELLIVKDILIEKAENYDHYTGKPAGADSKVKFVMKTDEIKVTEKATSAPVGQNTEHQSIWQKIVNFFKNLFKKH